MSHESDDGSNNSGESDVTGMISQIVDLEAYVLESPNLRDNDSKELLRRLNQAKMKLLEEQQNGGGGNRGSYLPSELEDLRMERNSRARSHSSGSRSRSGSRGPPRRMRKSDFAANSDMMDEMNSSRRSVRSSGSRGSRSGSRGPGPRRLSRGDREFYEDDYNDVSDDDDDGSIDPFPSHRSSRSRSNSRSRSGGRSRSGSRSGGRSRSGSRSGSRSRRYDDGYGEEVEYADFNSSRRSVRSSSRSVGSRSRGGRRHSASRSVGSRSIPSRYRRDEDNRSVGSRSSRGSRGSRGSRRMPDNIAYGNQYDDDRYGDRYGEEDDYVEEDDEGIEWDELNGIPQNINTAIGNQHRGNNDDLISEMRSTYTPAPTIDLVQHVQATKSTGSVFDSSRKTRKQKAAEDKDFDNAGYQPDLVVEERKGPLPLQSTLWDILAFLLTFPIPDCCIPKKGVGPKKAWREKLAIFILFLIFSAVFIVGVTLLPIFLCKESKVHYDAQQVENRDWTMIYGKVYDFADFTDKHPGGATSLENYMGGDASGVFPKLPPTELESRCLSPKLNETAFNATNSLRLQNISCPAITDYESQLAFGGDDVCHTNIVGPEAIDEKLGEYQEGILVVPESDMGNTGFPDGSQYIVIDKVIYNVTDYIDGLKQVQLEFSYDTSHQNDYAYLNEPLHNLIVNKANEDASELFHVVFPIPEDKETMKECLGQLYYHGEVDERYSETCQRIAISQYVFVGIFSFLTAVQVLCSLAYIARRPPFVKEDDMQAGVMVMVPCYNESDKELRKTIDSVLVNQYPDENKVLCVVADGVITGRGEAMSCPETLGDILGFDFSNLDDAFEYPSIGQKTTNFASIYSGVYQSDKYKGKSLKYLVVIKQGGPDEINTPRAGNRGKRDSQLLLFGIVNRLQYNRRPLDLDIAFRHALDNLDLSLQDIEYLMAIDADTRVSDTAMRYMIYHMEHDKSALACCGETRVDNKAQSFVTMIQVFEYYSAHHLKKAFESVFGAVTCLPGCFTMYRLYTEELQPLLTADTIYVQYARNDITSLHERNLYELGEDRMLTTLLLQTFNGMALCFVPEATCWTIVPHNFQILKSQRRRWINSTIHNMCELLKVETMCGICFFSMKIVVIFDLASTFLLPSGCVYLYYIVIDAIRSAEPLGPLQVIAFAYLGIMMVPFIFRAQWDFFFWFIMFLIGGIPMFYFYLPIYAFWNMDDLSWGKTRQVKTNPEAEAAAAEAAEKNAEATLKRESTAASTLGASTITSDSPTSSDKTGSKPESAPGLSASLRSLDFNDLESNRTPDRDHYASAPAIGRAEISDLNDVASRTSSGARRRRIEDRYNDAPQRNQSGASTAMSSVGFNSIDEGIPYGGEDGRRSSVASAASTMTDTMAEF